MPDVGLVDFYVVRTGGSKVGRKGSKYGYWGRGLAEVGAGNAISEWKITFRNALIKLSFSDLYAGGPTEAIANSWSPTHVCESLGGKLEEVLLFRFTTLQLKKKKPNLFISP